MVERRLIVLMTGLSAGFALATAPAAKMVDVSRIPKVAVSSDGFVKVVAADVPGDEVGFRRPILSFASGAVRSLASAYSLAQDRRYGEARILIRAMDGTTNDTRVLARAVRRGGSSFTEIRLPSPGYSDIPLLRLEIAKAFFRAHAEALAGKGAPPPRDGFPEWLVQGLERCADTATAQEDKRFVLGLWQRGRMPFFPAVCTDMRTVRGPAAAIPGFVASWMKEKNLVKPWLKRFAAGEKWDGVKLAEELTGETEPWRQDRAFDERMVRLSRTVLVPGRTGDSDLRIFASHLLLYPPFFERMCGANGGFWTFREVVSDPLRTNMAVRASAGAKARELPLFAIGRGDELVRAASAYSGFLYGLASGGACAEELAEMLDDAETKLEIAYEAERNRKNDNR